VPDQEKENIFGRFYRVGKSRSQPGNGLGLSLVSAVVELHEGRIDLADAEPGAEKPGLKVTLYLPAQPSSADNGERESSA
ncbi:MAG: sensor histidine kinase, partial [Pseudomonadota bacterium]